MWIQIYGDNFRAITRLFILIAWGVLIAQSCFHSEQDWERTLLLWLVFCTTDNHNLSTRQEIKTFRSVYKNDCEPWSEVHILCFNPPCSMKKSVKKFLSPLEKTSSTRKPTGISHPNVKYIAKHALRHWIFSIFVDFIRKYSNLQLLEW